LAGLLIVVFLFAVGMARGAEPWAALGPEGGDVRSLSSDPQNPDRIFLGTSSGTLYLSTNGGQSWRRWAHLGTGQDYVLDHVLIDPRDSSRMFAAAWSLQTQQAGDLFRSTDGGHTWEAVSGLHNKSLRALAMAPSDHRILVAGAVDGVYESTNSGEVWNKISVLRQDIGEVESVAIDPTNPQIIYAGTWHLAWKTSDGGATWHRINKGMIEDSDVFSIVIDPANTNVVYASACSGIYKSENGGEHFQKAQGIPFTARRTRVLKQDPRDPAIVYAGTTEGLWRTLDAGQTWEAISGKELVVNDIWMDARRPEQVLLATERRGVLASNNSARSFVASNRGFAHRYITSVVADKFDADTIYVSVLNDQEMGGVFVSHERGQRWGQKNDGLGGADVLTMKQAGNGDLLAGTSNGLYMLPRNGNRWRALNGVAARVNSLDVTASQWLAATSAGLFVSSDRGTRWSGGAVLGRQDFVSVAAAGDLVALATPDALLVRKGAGASWRDSGLPTHARDVIIVPTGANVPALQARGSDEEPASGAWAILVAAWEGVFRSDDLGAHWVHVTHGLPERSITSVTYEESSHRVLATTDFTGIVFESEDGGQSWHEGPDAGYPLRRLSVTGGRMVGATDFDGVVIQPEVIGYIPGQGD
jgi:photosystem II stability/assembly factor-like uncharacterized protein